VGVLRCGACTVTSSVMYVCDSCDDNESYISHDDDESASSYG
jgi:hypothetical protein